jgi:hypothetical protein
MARQKGVLTLDGKAGTLSFFQGRNGFGARSSDGMNGNRIREDDKFIRTRENGMEFGRAGKAGKILRDAFRSLTVNMADGRLTSRMTSHMVKVVKSDPTNGRGLRRPENGDFDLLVGFEFNGNTPLTQVFLSPFNATLDAASNSGVVNLPGFNPQKNVSAPKGATHYRFLLGICAVDFLNAVFFDSSTMSELQELSAAGVPASSLTVGLPASEGDTLPLFLAFGIEFLQVVNGIEYSINNTKNNAMRIVAVG